MTEKLEFKKTGRGNEVLYFDDFFISYNPAPWAGTVFCGDDNSDETALVKDGEYYILNGNFKKEYIKLIISGGWKDCYAFYLKKKKEIGSFWSTPIEK